MTSGQQKSVPNFGMINNIQAMRGVASLVVFVGHALLLMPGIGLDEYFSFFGVVASSGVDIFFVISGFIITVVAMKSGEDDSSRLRGAWNFGVKRVVRIYPIYWIVFALAFMLSPWVDFAPPVTDIKPVAQQFFLLTHVNSYIMAAWSLAFEVFFYAVVVVALIISPRSVGKVLAGWAVITVGVIAYDYFVGHRGWIGLLPFSPLILEFIMGMIVAYVIRQGVTAFAVTSALVGVVSFVVGSEVMRGLGWSTLNPWYRTFYNGLPSAFIIYAVVALEYRKVWVFSSAWVKLGDASYSIYIWHQFIFYSILTLISGAAWISGVPPLFLVCIWLVPALVFGFFSYYRIELPIQRWLNGALLIDRRVAGHVGRGRRLAYVAAVCVLLVSVCSYSMLSRVRAQEKIESASVLGELVESYASKGSLSAAAGAAGLRLDPDVRGHFDGVYMQPGQIRVHGWAADTSSDARDVKLLVFFCGKYIGAAPRDKRRADVAESLRLTEINTGFTANISFEGGCSADSVEGLAVAKGGGFTVFRSSLSG